MTKQQAVKPARVATYLPPTKPTRALTPSPKPPAIVEEDIRIRAYELWESAGRPDGQVEQLWLQAERELREAAH